MLNTQWHLPGQGDHLSSYAADGDPGHILIFVRDDTTTNSAAADKRIETYGGAVGWSEPWDAAGDYPPVGGTKICEVDTNGQSTTEEKETLPSSYLPTAAATTQYFHTCSAVRTEELGEPTPDATEHFAVTEVRVRVYYDILSAYDPTG